MTRSQGWANWVLEGEEALEHFKVAYEVRSFPFGPSALCTLTVHLLHSSGSTRGTRCVSPAAAESTAHA